MILGRDPLAATPLAAAPFGGGVLPPPIGNFVAAVALAALVGSTWAPPPAAAQLPRWLPPSVTGVPVNGPPGVKPTAPLGLPMTEWGAQLSGKLAPALSAVRVDRAAPAPLIAPPPGVPSLEFSAQLSGKLPAVLSNVAVNSPPSREPTVQFGYLTWQPLDFTAQPPRWLPIVTTAVPVNNPPGVKPQTPPPGLPALDFAAQIPWWTYGDAFELPGGPPPDTHDPGPLPEDSRYYDWWRKKHERFKETVEARLLEEMPKPPIVEKPLPVLPPLHQDSEDEVVALLMLRDEM